MDDASTPPKKGKPRISLSSWIMMGVGAGLAAGLLFGEYCASVKIFGDIFVGLLQMTILPFLLVSLIHGIGQLTREKAGMLAIRAGMILVVIWGVILAVVLSMPLAFPPNESGSFYSSNIVAEQQGLDILGLYIPSNPFRALANSIVPAVVVFSLMFGVALIDVAKKQPVLDVLEAISETLNSLMGLLVKLTPVGVFCITANAAGTMTLEEFGRLNVYSLTYIFASMFLAVWVLPMLVSIVTPFRYGELFRAGRDLFFTAFVLGNLFVVIPLLVDRCGFLIRKGGIKHPDAENFVEILIPTSFNFPTVGKLLALLFILFSAWFTGNTIGLGDYPRLLVVGFFSLFSGVDLALPFLLDQLKLPADMFQLYILSGVLNGRFATLASAMNLFAFTLMATCACTGHLNIRWGAVMRFLGITAIILVCSLVMIRFGLKVMVGPGVDKGKLIQQMTVSQPVEAIYHEFRPTESLDIDRSVPPLERIRKRGFLRVGYQPESLPYAFVNDDGQLVGFSVDLAHWLAKSLEVSLEFIPMRLDELEEMTKGGVVDLVVSAPVFEEFLDDLRFSEPYIHITAAILCEDHLRHRFKSIDEVRQIKDLRLGFGIQQPLSKVEEYLPNAELVPLESYYDFLEGKTTNVMALLSSAESGSAWSLLYPSFSVVVPQPDPIQVPVAFAVYPGDSELILFLNDWIKLVKDDGTLTKLYNYWILGKNIIEKKPRWSVVRNVFGLGESERRKVD